MVSVSIGMPVYNGEAYVGEAIQSILRQSFGDFELVISDNASTDATEEICQQFAHRDRRIRYSRLPSNLGAAYNYNSVFAQCSGEYFKWAAHDDVLHPHFLARCIEAFPPARRPAPALVYPCAEFIDEAGRVIGPDWGRQRATAKAPAIRAFQVIQGMSVVCAIAGLFRRDVLARTRLIGSYASSDYVLLLETALRGRIVRLDGPPLFQRRIHRHMSRQANKTEEGVLRWFDPSARVSRMTSRQRLYLEYMRAVFEYKDINFLEQGACAACVVSSIASRRLRVAAAKAKWRLRLRAGSAANKVPAQ